MRQRIRIRFTKTGELQWISHHDLMRLWERLLRRSGLPIAFSEGFNPRPRMSFPIALGVGIASEDEAMEVELARWTTAEALREALVPLLPEGMRLTGLELVGPSERGQASRVEYAVRLTEAEAEMVARALPEVLARPVLPVVRQRNGKPIDLKPYVLSAACEGDTLVFSFRVTLEGTARPEEFCSLLGLSLGSVPSRVVRRRTEIGPATTVSSSVPPPVLRRNPPRRGRVHR